MTTPSGIIAEPPDKLRDLIAGTSAFQTWTGTANAAAAKLRTFFQAQAFEGIVRPFMLVYWKEASVRRGGYVFGVMEMLFQSDTPLEFRREAAEEQSFAEALLDHANNVGAVLAEAANDAEGDGAIHLDHDEMFQMTLHPARLAEQDRSPGLDYVVSRWQLNWGLRR